MIFVDTMCPCKVIILISTVILHLLLAAPLDKRPADASCLFDDQCLSEVCRDLSKTCAALHLNTYRNNNHFSASTKKIRGGDYCRRSDQCFSGLCLEGLCALDSAVPGKVGIGGRCETGEHCFSGLCALGKCRADLDFTRFGWKPVDTPCNFSRECFSDYCHDEDRRGQRRCAIDSPGHGKVGGGGPCCHHDNCYSSLCLKNKCAAHSPVPGKVGGGGRCDADSQCFSNYCYQGQCATDSISSGKVGSGGACRSHDQCFTARCKQGLCH